MADKKGKNKFSQACFRALWKIVALIYPKTTVEGLENLPEEPCIIVGNHAQLHGPVTAELCFSCKRAIWCAGQMMHLKEVPGYAYQDFWSGKPGYIRWLFKLISYLIAPASVFVFNNAHTIPVYRDARILSTFRQSVEALREGSNLIIFPECAQPDNNIVNQFQDRFIDLAKMVHRRDGRQLAFVPLYVAPKLKKLYLGRPTVFDPEAPMEEERRRISRYLSEEITKIARALPEHTVVPYSNISKKLYPKNTACEAKHEKTCG